MFNAAKSSGGEGAFSRRGVEVGNLGDIEYIKSEMDGAAAPTDKASTTAGSVSAGVDAATTKENSATSPPSYEKKDKRDTWWDRDAGVSSALKAHSLWVEQTKGKFEDCVKEMEAELDCDAKIRPSVLNEQTLVKSRLYAIKLVMGTAGWVTAAAAGATTAGTASATQQGGGAAAAAGSQTKGQEGGPG